MANAAASLLLAPSTVETPALVKASFAPPEALTSAAVVGSVNGRTGALTVESEEVQNRHASAPVPNEEIKGLQRNALFFLEPLENLGGAEITKICVSLPNHMVAKSIWQSQTAPFLYILHNQMA